jgi:uncharacterized protein
MEKRITIIVSVINDCNSDCCYCYMTASRRSKSRLSSEEVDRLICNSSLGFDKVEFCWHGGEPLLMGINFYQDAVDLQKKLHQETGTIFKNTMQTNGILLDDNWLKFLSRNKFHIGVSFDAPPDVHLIQRPLVSGTMSKDDYLQIFQRMTQYQLAVGTLCVVTKRNVNRAEEIFDFYNSAGVTSYSFLPLKTVPHLNCPLPPSNEELFRLYADTFELWMYKPNKFRRIEPLNTMIRCLLGQHPRSCSFGNPCLKRMIAITPEGYVVPCSALTSDEFILGSIFEHSLGAILSNKKVLDLRNKRDRCIENHCRGCKFISICRGGCRNVAFWKTGFYDGEYPYCESRKKTLEYLCGRLNEIFKKAKPQIQTKTAFI